MLADKSVYSVVIFIAAILFASCKARSFSGGHYTNIYNGIASKNYRIYQSPDSFEYSVSTESNVREYSTGHWRRGHDSIFCTGFNSGNVKALNIQKSIEPMAMLEEDKVVIQYQPETLDTFIKLDVVINHGFRIRILGDTSFASEQSVRYIQIKSYLSHEGVLFATMQLVDTLTFTSILLEEAGGHDVIHIKVDVKFRDFFRVVSNDTLRIQNRKTLIKKQMRLNKS